MDNSKLKFRVWDTENKRWADARACLIEPCCMNRTDSIFTFQDIFAHPESDDFKLVFQQYIGKKDIRNKEIFVGDIIKLNNKGSHVKQEYWNPIFEVIWTGFSFGLKYLGGGQCGDSCLFDLQWNSHKLFEILGNIFESIIIIPKSS